MEESLKISEQNNLNKQKDKDGTLGDFNRNNTNNNCSSKELARKPL